MKDIDAKITSEIKKHYIKPAITFVEKENNKREGRASILGCLFNVEQKIWLDHYMKEYRVVIPENVENKMDILEHWNDAYPIETRFLTYVPTGKIIYNNSLPHKEAIVYEYILESLLGKKELK